jgi:hypothetical protein
MALHSLARLGCLVLSIPCVLSLNPGSMHPTQSNMRPGQAPSADLGGRSTTRKSVLGFSQANLGRTDGCLSAGSKVRPFDSMHSKDPAPAACTDLDRPWGMTTGQESGMRNEEGTDGFSILVEESVEDRYSLFHLLRKGTTLFFFCGLAWNMGPFQAALFMTLTCPHDETLPFP